MTKRSMRDDGFKAAERAEASSSQRRDHRDVGGQMHHQEGGGVVEGGIILVERAEASSSRRRDHSDAGRGVVEGVVVSMK